MPYLFSYGTLRDAHVQQQLFGEIKHSVPAVLKGYEVAADADGFFYLNPSVSSSVVGALLSISARDLLRADQWEEVPIYERVQLSVSTSERLTPEKESTPMPKADMGKPEVAIEANTKVDAEADAEADDGQKCEVGSDVVIDAWVYLKTSPKAALKVDNTLQNSAGDMMPVFQTFVRLRNERVGMPFYDDYQLYEMANASDSEMETQPCQAATTVVRTETADYLEISFDNYPVKVMLAKLRIGGSCYAMVYTPLAIVEPMALEAALSSHHALLEKAMATALSPTPVHWVCTELRMTLPVAVQQHIMTFDVSYSERLKEMLHKMF